MSRPVPMLWIGDDPDLSTEVEAAIRGLSDVRVLPHFADDTRVGLRLARSQQPEVIGLANLPAGGGLEATVEELRQAAPGAAIVALLDSRRFESGDAESAFLVEATRAGLRDFLRRPLSSAELAACLRRLAAGSERGRGSGDHGTVTCFTSNKGGVGKTTLAVNVAAELAQRGSGSVLLVDAALQLGLCATMLDLEPAVTMRDVVDQIDRLDGTLLREMAETHECGLDLLAAPGDAVDAADVSEEHLSRILAVARATYDHVIVDTFPMLDGIAIAAFDRADTVWQVVAPTVPTVLGAERLVGLLEGVGVEPLRQRIVVNTSVPSHAGQLSARDVATRLGRDVDVVIPFSRAAVASCNSGRPVVLSNARWSGFRRRVRELADLIVESNRAALEAVE